MERTFTHREASFRDKKQKETPSAFYIRRFLRHIAVKKVTILCNIYNKKVEKSSIEK